ncbi:LOW QUALITY PROTEIN: thyrotroph embryonic factor-like [Haliotis rubra]|uniref:LOW QUALITY PROTEIN: thyrotroph embryonic factor-like n=1 Tax=Haliotis rubra TaxID=36100 RepID=UPI001EE50AA7|nr:LOW QUALITY PROTEIN: thyrotroph embryonic factor-like [Haliotis rubra]
MANYGMFNSGLTLKALLENPELQSPPVANTEKDKKVGKDGMYDSGSAFLGPNLWDKTYDSTDFNLEYMDLDEFLSENGIPINLDNVLNGTDVTSPEASKSPPSNGQRSPKASPLPFVSRSPPPSQIQPSPSQIQPSPQPSPLPSPPQSPPQPVTPVATYDNLPASPASALAESKLGESKAPESPLSMTSSTAYSPVGSPAASPKSIDFSVSQDDLTLVNVEGQENFDPRKRAFSEEELKPQPMIKKSRKIFVPDDNKDDKYWCRRKKNNVAAKRSRDARRIKENQIAMRASFLEKENSVLRTELEKIKKENSQLKHSLAKYEPGKS